MSCHLWHKLLIRLTGYSLLLNCHAGTLLWGENLYACCICVVALLNKTEMSACVEITGCIGQSLMGTPQILDKVHKSQNTLRPVRPQAQISASGRTGLAPQNFRKMRAIPSGNIVWLSACSAFSLVLLIVRGKGILMYMDFPLFVNNATKHFELFPAFTL